MRRRTLVLLAAGLLAVAGAPAAHAAPDRPGAPVLVTVTADTPASVVVVEALDKAFPPPGVHSWFVDLPTNAVVVRADPAASDAARAFAAASGAGPDAVRVEASSGLPRPVYDIRGGDNFGGCSVGFPVLGGFLTAGHCSSLNNPTVGYNGVAQGVTRGSTRPGRDHAFVQTNAAWTPQPVVNNFNGGLVQVAGAQDAPVGAAVCRSGRTSGWHCGVIQRRGVTQQVASGGGVVTVYNQIITSACAEPANSGGPLMAGNEGHHTFYLATEPGSATLWVAVLNLGQRGDVPVAGDWDANGVDSIGVFRPPNNTFYRRLNNSGTDAATHTPQPYGQLKDLPLAGDRNGDRRDTVGVYRLVERRFYLYTESGSTTSHVYG